MKYNITSYYSDERTASMNTPVFLVEVWQAGGSGKYGKICVRPVYLWDGTYHFYDKRDTESILHWFACDAQFDWQSGDEPYGIRTGYRDDEILIIEEIDTVEKRVSFLKRITKKLWLSYGELGRPRTYAQHVLRLANVMGIKTFITKTSPVHAYPYEYRMLNIQDLERIFENAYQTGRLGY